LFLPVAQKKRLNLHFLHKGEAILCDVDIKFFRNIINNLINNAVKYTDVGKIWIEVKREINFAVIEVGDTGIGIPKAKQDIIWEEFRQGSEGKGRSFEGTGLGLSIARKCVQLMKGHISLRSEPGKGAVFTIRLPLAKTTTIHSPRTEPNETRAASASGKIKNVLLVEDDELSIDYITMILSGRAAVHPALNGEEALRMVHANKFDIILMDINLKRGLSGVEITERVRKISGYEKVPIVAVTAYAMSGDKEEFLSKGMTHYLSKPFSRKELFALMDQLETSK
jgi:CheY-like chemotaxis protein